METINWDNIVEHSVYPDGAPKTDGGMSASVADPNAWRKDRSAIDEVEAALVDLMQVKAASTRPAVNRLLQQCQGDFDGVLAAIADYAADTKNLKYARSERATPYTIVPSIQTLWARRSAAPQRRGLLERFEEEREKARTRPARRGTMGAAMDEMRRMGLL